MEKEKIEQIAEIIAEMSGYDYHSVPFHRQLTYRAKAREVIAIMEKLKGGENE